jgi:uncharacterized caspase-like protein
MVSQAVKCADMKRYFFLFLIIFFLCPYSLLGQNKENQKRIALIIGNQNYNTSTLDNPLNDSRDIARTLSFLEFEIILKEDANKREMIKAIESFGERLKDARVGLFYYSGHGVQLNGENYLIPVEEQIRFEEDVEFEAVNAGRVLSKMEKAGDDKLYIVILDACRNNPFPCTYRSARQGLATMNAPSGTIIAYSTSPGHVALDGRGRNSPYTGALLKYIPVAGLTIEQMFKCVRREVNQVTEKQQTPWETTSLRGDFYFSGGKTSSPVIIPSPVVIKPKPDPKADKIQKCAAITNKMSMGLLLTVEEIEFAKKHCNF